MTRNVVILALCLAAPALTAAAPARAQGTVKDPSVIGFCLCAQQRLDGEGATMRARQQSYDTSRDALAAMDRDLADRRSKLDVYDNAAVEAYRQLLDKRDAAAASFANDVTPAYNASIARYNQSLSDYNGSCAGKSFDQTAYDTARTALSCPKP